MPRIRTIKPEFWSSPATEGMDPWARLLYIAMWNWADDYGRGTANPKELAAFAFPYDSHIGAKEIPSMLKEVATRFDVIFYRVSGRRYYVIPSWDRHQRTERRAQPQHPGPEEAEEYDVDPDDQHKCMSTQEVPASSVAKQGNSDAIQGSSGPGTGEQGNRGTGEERTSGTEAPDTSTPRPDVEQLCERLLERVTANGVKATITKQWRQEARRLLDRDKRDLDQALGLIEWATEHSFWSANIHSIPKFRQQYDKLRMQQERPPLRAVAGDHQPWTNPTDPSAYEGPL